ncbi:MAG TPA: methyltransferase domain-containing protein [Xanthomonadaceae bacterium]
MSDAAPEWLPASFLEHAATYASKAAFDADRAARADLFDARYQQATGIVRDAGIDGVLGHCPLCEAPGRFVSPDHADDVPNFREGLVCERCHTPARVRAGLALLRTLCPRRDARIYVTEQASAAYLWLRSHRPRTIGSEFERNWQGRLRLSRHLWRARRFGLVRFEDVTRLRLETASQQAVASFDVIEHVADDRAALREFARVTEPGGWLVLTAPFAGTERSIERTRVAADGRIEHLLPPEYHGDPLGGGVLCHRHYGWDLLEALREAGYRDAVVAMPWWPEAGLFDGLATVIARR